MTIFESNVNAAFAHFQPDDEDPLFDKDQDPFQRWIQGSPAPAGSEFDFIVASEDNHDPLTRLSWLELMGILAALRTGYVEQPNRSFLFRFEVWRTQREPEEQVGWGELLLNADADSGVASPESAATGRRRGRRGRVL
ncbi:uncharacterized protein KY384_006238 [Bacidia gigantensis]|uniref:uncharacterized protein n=1 Tax=Bacidia gigantensis TaxID=2732470 RepID=UPI001D039BA4|nr:uncharacterized protein KY384_006238 [Bacidia gigantensis]KAG8529601.1 hypothetical protein KY384_006238 [Bacidia gigantensis]